MGCDCKQTKTCGSRFLQEYDVSANDVLNVMTIHSECGQGYMEFWSPSAFVIWTVRRQVDGVAETVTYRTGPASRAGVFLVNGGELTCTVYQVLNANLVDEYNGSVTVSGAVPESKVFARFVNCQPDRAKPDSVRFIDTPYDRPVGLPGQLYELSYAPHFTKTALVSASNSVIVQVNAFGTITQTRTVDPGVTLPFTITPWERLDFLVGLAPAQVNVVWSEKISILN